MRMDVEGGVELQNVQTKAMDQHINIPPAFKKFFWDADFSKLKFPEHQNYVLGRLMAFGDLASIQWIIRSFDHDMVCRYLEKKGAYTLDRKSFLFWKNILEMDDLWLSA